MTSSRAEGTPRLVLDWLTVKSHVQGVAFLTGEPADLLNDFKQTNCWMHVGDAVVPGPRKFWKIAQLARHCTREFRPDLVIAWPNGFSHWIFLGVRSTGSRTALLSHAGNPPGENWYGRYCITWLCLWTAALCRGKMVACSRYVQRQFTRIALVPKIAVRFAYNSVQVEAIARRADAARATRQLNGHFRVIMVATLESHKDHVTLIRAAKILRERGVKIEILLAGAGRLEASLKDLTAQLGVGGFVKFLGARRDVPELLGQSDLFVLSTTPREGRPGVILEALAAGLPIIATDVEPLREVLEEGRWGKLVGVGDIEALATALDDAANAGPADLKVIGERREFARAFSPERMISDYLKEARW